MSKLTLVTVDNEVLRVWSTLDGTDEITDRCLVKFTCKDGSSAMQGAEFLALLFEPDWKGSGYFLRKSEDIVAAVTFYLNTNFLVQVTESIGEDYPPEKLSGIHQPGKTKVDAKNIEIAKVWLTEHPDSKLGGQKAAYAAGVTLAAMTNAMRELGRVNPSTKAHLSKRQKVK